MTGIGLENGRRLHEVAAGRLNDSTDSTNLFGDDYITADEGEEAEVQRDQLNFTFEHSGSDTSNATIIHPDAQQNDNVTTRKIKNGDLKSDDVRSDMEEKTIVEVEAESEKSNKRRTILLSTSQSDPSQLEQTLVDSSTYKMALEGVLHMMTSHFGTKEDSSTKCMRSMKECTQLRHEHEKLCTIHQKAIEYLDLMKGLNEDLKAENADMVKVASTLKLDLASVSDRYNRLLDHCKQRMKEANSFVEMLEERAAADRLALATKQATIKSLEQQVESKANENRELRAICDEFMERAVPNEAFNAINDC